MQFGCCGMLHKFLFLTSAVQGHAMTVMGMGGDPGFCYVTFVNALLAFLHAEIAGRIPSYTPL